MRIVFPIHNAYTDATSGAAHTIRTLAQWLVEAGHECRVLGTARFDGRPPADFEAHLAQLGVALRRAPASKTFVRSVRKPRNVPAGRPMVHFTLSGVPVALLLTRHNELERPDRLESEQFMFEFERLVEEFKPDLLVTYGAHPVVRAAMRRARENGTINVFSLRNHGYEDRRWFEHADHVLTCSEYLTREYRWKIGLKSVGIEPPIDWSQVIAPTEARAFVTFVNPTLAKGASLFARLADHLGSTRPDIPILVVQSAAGAESLNSIPGIDFGKYPQIMAAPPVSRPAEFFALTKILLVPSLFQEPFGRVAAEALINGIPPLVSTRGSLPQAVGGAGRVLPVPDWLDETSAQLPSVEEVQPWYDAVCELWDNPVAYAEASSLARGTGERLYSEAVLRKRYLEYFSSLGKGNSLFVSGD